MVNGHSVILRSNIRRKKCTARKELHNRIGSDNTLQNCSKRQLVSEIKRMSYKAH